MRPQGLTYPRFLRATFLFGQSGEAPDRLRTGCSGWEGAISIPIRKAPMRLADVPIINLERNSNASAAIPMILRFLRKEHELAAFLHREFGKFRCDVRV